MSAENYPVILYGAGDNDKSALALLRSRGVEPATFCSCDQNRMGKFYCGLPIMDRDQVTDRYGTRFKIWITPYSPVKEKIEAELLEMGFVDRGQILNPVLNHKEDESFECARMYSEMVITDDCLRVCCFDEARGLPRVTFTPGEDVEHYRAVIRTFNRQRAELIGELRSGNRNICTGWPIGDPIPEKLTHYQSTRILHVNSPVVTAAGSLMRSIEIGT